MAKHPLNDLPTSLHLTLDTGCMEWFPICSNDLLGRVHGSK